jgi:hypothetical protein
MFRGGHHPLCRLRSILIQSFGMMINLRNGGGIETDGFCEAAHEA